jgi:hypothetical protein
MSRRLKSVAVVSLAKNSSIPCSVEDYEFLFRMDFSNGGAANCVTGWGLDGGKPSSFRSSLFRSFRTPYPQKHIRSTTQAMLPLESKD